jgi:hypothetical protein
MPNPHYQRVLEQDRSLPAPLRWLSRAMSSWWTIGVLSVFVVGYVAAAHVPLGERYVWQWRMFDTTRHAMLTWWPLLVAAWLLAAVVIWSAMRRLPWRGENIGAFVAVLGLAIILVSQSWAFRSQSVGIAAVPITSSIEDRQIDALALNYTTRFGDTHERVLVVMAGGGAPVTLPLDDLPRWNDATGDDMPRIKLHDDPRLSAILGFGTRITTSAYLADGELAETDDGSQSATPTQPGFRDYDALPYPANALLALDITADLEDGGTKTTTVWLPFEPDGTDSLVPQRFFPVPGLGSVGLAFRPANKKMPFALASSMSPPPEKMFSATVHIADADDDGRLVQPSAYTLSGGTSFQHHAQDLEGVTRAYTFEWLRGSVDWTMLNGEWVERNDSDDTALIGVTVGNTNPFILVGLATFLLGVVLDRLLDRMLPRTKVKATYASTSEDKSAAAPPVE